MSNDCHIISKTAVFLFCLLFYFIFSFILVLKITHEREKPSGTSSLESKLNKKVANEAQPMFCH